MLDLKSLFPTVTAFIAFILTLLCLFAGTQRNFLEDVDLLTVSPIVTNYSTSGGWLHETDLARPII
jgi:hypothetical protein